MVNSNYARGRRAEYQAKEILEKQGFIVTRSSGSHGLFDIIAIDINFVRLIQIKSSKTTTTFPKEVMAELAEIQVPPHCRKEIWVKTKKGFNKRVIE